MPRLYNKYHKNAPRGTVYIGRPSPWGNPFVVGLDGNRKEVIAKFRDLVEDRPEFKERIKSELKGKDLVCYCYPAACHGDVILEIANAEED